MPAPISSKVEEPLFDQLHKQMSVSQTGQRVTIRSQFACLGMLTITPLSMAELDKCMWSKFRHVACLHFDARRDSQENVPQPGCATPRSLLPGVGGHMASRVSCEIRGPVRQNVSENKKTSCQSSWSLLKLSFVDPSHSETPSCPLRMTSATSGNELLRNKALCNASGKWY
jgi:hypothetical protein